jgi:hypothetical protein
MTGDTIIATDASRELLHRVAASPQFQKANRLRELLLYIGERSLHDPSCVLHEQEIGVDVLGRRPDYDTSHDTLVRVQVSQLRKKLQEHFFSGDGRNETLVIEIPKGSYVPVFRPRAEAHSHGEGEPAASAGNTHANETTSSRFRGLKRIHFALGGVIAVLLVAVLALAWTVYRVEISPYIATNRPTVNAFWRQLFDNGVPTTVVLSDITLIPFEKLMGQHMPLSEYESREFERLADQRLTEPVRSLAKEVVNRVSTSVSDVQVARDFGVLASENHLPLTLMSAREISSELMSSQNSIILGSWRANPWVGLFENQLNFRTEYHEEGPSMRFINSSPLKGEEATYPAEWRRTGYCRVAYLPNPRHTGSVLLISGSDVISTEAGGRLLTSESALRELRQKLGLKGGQPFPHFELLLRTQIVNNTVPSYEIVAYRIPSR